MCRCAGQGSVADQPVGKILAAWCSAPQGRQSMLDAYVSAYLNDKREIKKRLATKEALRMAGEAGCDAAAALCAEAERVHRFDRTRAAIVVRDATCALLRLGEALLREYAECKRLKGVLDFDDLVPAALSCCAAKGWRPGSCSSSTAGSTTS